MRIDRKLNLVVPIIDGVTIVKDKDGKETEEDNVVAYVHAVPISREVFETFFLVLSKTFASIYGDGLGTIAGPRVAMMLLKKVAQDLNMADEVERGLINEMRRLTNVLVPGEKGWESLPLQVAATQELISKDDVSEVENALAFFTVASVMHRRQQLPIILVGAARIWGAETSLLNSTEYAASLPTSTPVATSGAKATQSPIPS